MVKKGHKDVQKAVKDKEISQSIATEISKSENDKQPELLKTVKKEKISNPNKFK